MCFDLIVNVIENGIDKPSSNSPEKGMNPSLLPIAMGKVAEQTGHSSLGLSWSRTTQK